MRVFFVNVATIVAAVAALMAVSSFGSFALASQNPATARVKASNSAGHVISCALKANNPHNSGHVNGTVNSEMTASCSEAVSKIEGLMSLYREGTYIAPGGSNTTGNKATFDMTAATNCVNGNYYASGLVTVTFPAGYVADPGPAPGYVRGTAQNLANQSLDSATAPITC